MKMLLKYCDCPEWAPSINYVSGAMQRTIHHAKLYAGGVVFAYCPWCGKKLMEPVDEILPVS